MTTFQRNELAYYFRVRNEIAEAIRDGIPSVIEFHKNELVAMQMHTRSNRIRRACADALAALAIEQTVVAANG